MNNTLGKSNKKDNKKTQRETEMNTWQEREIKRYEAKIQI